MKVDERRTERLDLKKSFRNYERAVGTVNSVEGHLRKWYRDLLESFDRYPRLKRKQGDPLTPDFVVVFKGPYVIVGEAKRAMGLTDKSLEDRFGQLMSYDDSLTVKKNDAGGVFESAEHDIWVLLNPEYALKEAKRIKPLVDEERKNGKLGRGVVIFQINYDSQPAKSRWVCSWVTESDYFRDKILPEGRRLSDRHQHIGESIVIYPESFAKIQAKYYFCNDDAPDIYVAVILWSRIFRNMMPPKQREDWVENDCHGSVEFTVTLDEILRQELVSLGMTQKKDVVRKGLNLLSKGKLVQNEGKDKYLIRYKTFSPHVGEGISDEETAEIRANRVIEGIINAVTQTSAKSTPKPTRIVKTRRRTRVNPDQMSFGF